MELTRGCLIAADIDKTFLRQGDSNEKLEFDLQIAPSLLETAKNGTKIGLFTGNSIQQLSNRFLSYLIEFIQKAKAGHVLPQFHFFCNSGGVYFHIDEDVISEDNELSKIVFDNIREGTIRLEHFNQQYIERTRIKDEDAVLIKKTLEKIWEEYVHYIRENLESIKNQYFIDEVPTEDNEAKIYKESFLEDSSSVVEMRYFKHGENMKSTVQITLKPILSWKFAKDPKTKYLDDIRLRIIKKIHRQLDNVGLKNYNAKPGGSSSIDITQAKLDKAYGLKFLIDHLGIDGNERVNEEFGSNVIYLGDEVVGGGGNDFPVTKIPGVLVLAVNERPEFVIFKSRVIVPNDFIGPDASKKFLDDYNYLVKQFKNSKHRQRASEQSEKNAVRRYKEDWFSKRIMEKISITRMRKRLSAEELQVMYTFVTLINRNDESARKWTKILVDELDQIMEALDESEFERFSGIGSSHDDEP